ncbi:cupin domain-containing protein [Crenalkalicoccus roseus]|uniref:cupin domain-containing protein n=1 Tax=Crenalkalicoccus roseus TaxID=1485588 RepID=UPI001080949D|nr:cupin domain-containing protein [Crenalkalicoccus roseus]
MSGASPPADGGGTLRCRAPAVATVQQDDAQLRVTRWDFAPGAETGWHRHGWHYVVVPVTDGTLLLELPGGERVTARLTAGVSYSRPAGVEHNVVNAGDRPLSFVEIELKGLPG